MPCFHLLELTVFSDVTRDPFPGAPVSRASAALLCPHASLEAPSRKNLELSCEDSRWLVSPGSSVPGTRPPRSWASGTAAPGLAGTGGGGGTWPALPHVGPLLRRLRASPRPRPCLTCVPQSEAPPDRSRVPTFILDRCPPITSCGPTPSPAASGGPAPTPSSPLTRSVPLWGAARELPRPLTSSKLSSHRRDCCVTCCTTFYFCWELCLFVLKFLLCHI